MDSRPRERIGNRRQRPDGVRLSEEVARIDSGTQDR